MLDIGTKQNYMDRYGHRWPLPVVSDIHCIYRHLMSTWMVTLIGDTADKAAGDMNGDGRNNLLATSLSSNTYWQATWLLRLLMVWSVKLWTK